MNAMTESFLFIEILSAHVDRLEELFGDEWSHFQEQIKPLLQDFAAVFDDTQALMLVDEILAIGLQSRAAELFRALLRQAAEEAGHLDTTTRSIRVTDPTSGQTRKVEVSREQGRPAANQDDFVNAVRILGQVVLGEVEEPVDEPEVGPRYLNTFFTAPDGDSPIPPDRSLVRDQVYILYVDISPERKGLGEDEVPFPDSTLEEVWEDQNALPLTVWVASRDFKVESQVQTLLLPHHGPSANVRFTVIPRCNTNWGYIQVEVFYQGYLLQSKLIKAYIVPAV